MAYDYYQLQAVEEEMLMLVVEDVIYWKAMTLKSEVVEEQL